MHVVYMYSREVIHSLLQHWTSCYHVRSLIKPLYPILSNTQVECLCEKYSKEVMHTPLQQWTSYQHILWTQLYKYLVIGGHDTEEFGKLTYVKFNINLIFEFKI